MSSSLKEISIVGMIAKVQNRYVVTTEDGKEYELSAILPWEAVSADYGTGAFAAFLGKKMRVTGQTDGSTIYGAQLHDIE